MLPDLLPTAFDLIVTADPLEDMISSVKRFPSPALPMGICGMKRRICFDGMEEGKYNMIFDLENYSEDDIKISLEDRILTIEGLMKKSNPENPEETLETTFKRKLKIDDKYDIDKVECNARSGKLNITAPLLKKVEEKPKVREIPINIVRKDETPKCQNCECKQIQEEEEGTVTPIGYD
ncbi:hypothetical protein WR25_08300 [Diploscapter pachys]|uniref:SHSP domain-containing protein n=1 Tax=Diploscapter pachys TaxID=2018661 RepID=A0A2A2LVL3_9BILA|nr:hypothetical protein WR25_08300 [Diploscapter pachys]